MLSRNKLINGSLSANFTAYSKAFLDTSEKSKGIRIFFMALKLEENAAHIS
jgi:hypothetical protein